jgi:hypothetical protein
MLGKIHRSREYQINIVARTHRKRAQAICMRFGESLTLDYNAIARKGKNTKPYAGIVYG